MKIVLIIGTVLILGVGAIVLIGSMLPVQHRVSRNVKLVAGTDRVWSLISDFQTAPNWRSDIRKVERIETSDGVVWKEIARNGDAIAYATVEESRPIKLVRKIVGEGLPFGGRWTFELQPQVGGGSSLTITEDGEVYNPIFRFVSRWIVGQSATLDRYLAQLKQKLGEN